MAFKVPPALSRFCGVCKYILRKLTEDAVPSALSGFHEFLKDFKWVLAQIAGLAAIPKIVNFLFGFRPPWPEEIGEVCLYAGLCSLVVLIFVYTIYERVSKRTARILIGLFFVLLIVFGAAYLRVSGRDVYEFDSQPNPIVGGSELLPKVAEQINSTFTEGEALEGNEYDPFGVWQKESIYSHRDWIVYTWVPFYATLSFYVGIFVLDRRKRYSASRKSKAPRKSKKK